MEKQAFNLEPEQEIVEIFGNNAQGYYYELFRRFDRKIKKEIALQIKKAHTAQKISKENLLKEFNRLIEQSKKFEEIHTLPGDKDYKKPN